MALLNVPKRVLLGRPMRSDRLEHTLLPKRLALPVFSSDALSSVAYATQEIMVALLLAGTALLHFAPYAAAGVVVLLLVVTVSYRQTVKEYPSGGGAYIVAHENLGANAGLIAASALLIDYVLTVSVSVAAGVDAIVSARGSLAPHAVAICIGFIAAVTLINLRGLKESGTVFAIPTYGFVIGVYVLLTVALVRILGGAELVSDAARFKIEPEHLVAPGAATAFLVLRAFASGCTALTGVEAISNGVPAFKRPASVNAAKTLMMMAALSVTMFIGITALALHMDARYVEDVHHLVGAPDGYQQRTVMAQIAAAVFGDGSFLFYYVQAFTAGILILAANTAFQDFPRLASILSQDRYLPRQLHNRGDRLVFSNGIVMLAGFASLLVFVFDARVTKLIQLYIVGVFVSFTLSQLGMVRHWQKKEREDPTADHGRILRAKLVNGFGAVATFVVLIVVLIAKFTHGAYIVVITIPIIFAIMKGINRHYRRVAVELRADDTRPVLPSRMHAVVLVSQLHNPTLRALNYAKAIRPTTLEALYVATDDEESARLQREWDAKGIDVPLVIRESPYREVTGPVLDYVRNFPRQGERDVVTVIIPEFVVGKWWEHLLHNQSALVLKGRLLFQPGVAVISVPWHLSSSPEPEAPVESVATRRVRLKL